MKDSDKSLLWQYRYFLKEKSPKALVKFLQSAKLDDEREQTEALKILNEWDSIQLEDALPLLSRKFAANKYYNLDVKNDPNLGKVYNQIRSKAIKCLLNENTDTIMSIMLQLVQAFRYEYYAKSQLKDFLINKGKVFENLKICNTFHWLVHLEQHDPQQRPEAKGKDAPPEEMTEDQYAVKEEYQSLYDEFMEKLQKDHPMFHENIYQQLEFRRKTLETAYKVRYAEGNNKE